MPTFREILSSAIALFMIIAIFLIIIQIINAIKLRKQKEKFRNIHLNLKPGDEVLLASGIFGRVKKIQEEYVILEIAKNVEVKASRYSISQII